jgi:wyosine [tRNA(Phe)-imidazoG37] synthetase (radical SAM superfamily)
MTNKQSIDYRYLFGPVPSRRLGKSLGVDLVPHKTCTLNCIYCECGRTTHLTLKKDVYISIDQIKKELADFLSHDPKLDFITFSGGGEPTLNSGLGEIVHYLKSEYPKYKVALLTNGTLLHLSEIRKQVLDVDLIIASLDAASKKNFDEINRPHPGLNLSKIIEGLITFKEDFRHLFRIEIFLVPGVNDHEDELSKLKQVLDLIHPDSIHLNTLDRPGAESWVVPAEKKSLAKIAKYLHHADMIRDHPVEQKDHLCEGGLYERLLSTIRRRPCTGEDISQILGVQLNDVIDRLDALKKDGAIKKIVMPRGVFYTIRG